MPLNREQRLINQLDMSGKCWLWRGRLQQGYGFTCINGEADYTHRHAYREWVGVIPEGYTIDHLCEVKACCNPAHLEAVTVSENVIRKWKRNLPAVLRELSRSR